MNRRQYIANAGLVLGYTITFGTLSNIMQSCKDSKGSYSLIPDMLNDEQFKFLSQLTNTILPKSTTSISAIDCKVPEFIGKVVKSVFNNEDRKDFIEGLESLARRCEEDTSKSFADLDQEQKNEWLSKIDATEGKLPPNMWGISLESTPSKAPMYRKLKQLTLMGYFTSKELADSKKSSTTGNSNL